MSSKYVIPTHTCINGCLYMVIKTLQVPCRLYFLKALQGLKGASKTAWMSLVTLLV